MPLQLLIFKMQVEYPEIIKKQPVYYRLFFCKSLDINKLHGNICAVDGGGKDAAPEEMVERKKGEKHDQHDY